MNDEMTLRKQGETNLPDHFIATVNDLMTLVLTVAFVTKNLCSDHLNNETSLKVH